MEILIIILAIIFFPITLVAKASNSVNKKNDKMDLYHLNDHERYLVEHEGYDPSQFEDDPDEMEEDDYYNDDF